MGQKTHTYLSVESPNHNDFYGARGFPLLAGRLRLSADGTMLPNMTPSLDSQLYFSMRTYKIKTANPQYNWTYN